MALCSCIVFLLLFTVNVWSYTEFTVPCDATTPVCECPPLTAYGKDKIDVCIFSLEIIRLQTFTRYRIDPFRRRVLTRLGGSVWYINETNGEYSPFDKYDDHLCSIAPLNDTVTCTHPLSVDGKTFRSLVTINGHFPGPTLIVSYNQTLVVNVTNSLMSQAISLHWHGLQQNGTNWMDGVDRLTQCAIAPGTYFTYIFQAFPSGTFWYHSHVDGSSLRVDGAYGALIIKEPNDVLENASDQLGSFIDDPSNHTILLQDFFKTKFFDYRLQIHSGSQLYNSKRSPDPTYTSLPTFTQSVDGSFVGGVVFWSALMNGLGRYPGLSYTKTRLSMFTVFPSMRYRFRVIGAMARQAFRLSIDEHKLLVVSTDGVLLKPVAVDFLVIDVGERYDFIVETKSLLNLSHKSDFMIRAETLETIPPLNHNEPLQPLGGHLAEGILHYHLPTNNEPLPSDYSAISSSSVPVVDRCTSQQPCVALNCVFKDYPPSYNISCMHVHQLKLLNPLTDEMLPSVKPDEYLILNFGFEGSGTTSSVNARKSKLPSFPLSLAADTSRMSDVDICRGLNNPTFCNDTFDAVLATDCICTHMRNISYGMHSSVQMVFASMSVDKDKKVPPVVRHPIHIHGHHFHVVHIGFGDYLPNGAVVNTTSDITCLGKGREGCTVPSWSAGKDYAIGKSGKISSIALMKDTIAVPAGGYVVAYLVPDNPGYWLLHCHISDHSGEGMSIVVSEGVDRLSKAPDGMPSQCGDFVWSAEDYFKHSVSGLASIGRNSECSVDTYYYFIVVILSVLVCVLLVSQILLSVVYYQCFC